MFIKNKTLQHKLEQYPIVDMERIAQALYRNHSKITIVFCNLDISKSYSFLDITLRYQLDLEIYRTQGQK